MRLLLILSILFIFCSAESDVVVLTDSTFDSFLEKNPIVLVKFFAEWCGHCKELKPEYEKAARKMKEEGKPYVFAEVEAPKQTQLSSRFSISGFPTLKLFINGNPIDYDGARNAEAIISFIEKKVLPPTSELSSVEEVKAKVESKGLRCIFVGDSVKELTVYADVAKDVNEYLFFHTSEEIGKKVFTDLSSMSSVILFKDFDEKKLVLTGPLTKSALQSFLNANMLPNLGDIDEKAVKLIFQSKAKKGVFLFRSKTDSEKLDKLFADVAKSKKSPELLFLTSDGTKDWDSRIKQYLGLEDSDYPVIEIIEQKDEIERFRYKGEMITEKIAEFLDQAKAGKIERYLKSEEVPKENKGPVYKVVGKTFQKEVIENDLDVIVKFYAPWCGHCKALAPKYISLAEAMQKENEKLKFAEIDATKNDVVGQHLQGFPTIRLWTAGNKTHFIEMDGQDRSMKGIAKFLKEKCTHPIVVPELKEEPEKEPEKEAKIEH